LAKILRSENSLHLQLEALDRELGRRKVTRVVAWGLAAACFTWGVTASILKGSVTGVFVGLFFMVLAGGYEMRLREIVKESHNLEGGHRGEQKTANALAEQLADDHVILNDLEFSIGFERCQIDHLILAPSGIYVMESKFWTGTLTGDVYDTQWTKARYKGKTQSVKSPVLQSERQRRMFITLLTEKVPEDRIHAMAVFTHPAIKLCITNRENRAFLLGEAIRFINDRCFDPPVLTAKQIGRIAEHINKGQK